MPQKKFFIVLQHFLTNSKPETFIIAYFLGNIVFFQLFQSDNPIDSEIFTKLFTFSGESQPEKQQNIGKKYDSPLDTIDLNGYRPLKN